MTTLGGLVAATATLGGPPVTTATYSIPTRNGSSNAEAKPSAWDGAWSAEYTPGHGLYRIVDAISGAYVAGGEPYPFSLLLKDAEALLLGAHHPRPPKGGRG
jgi:hypothetical protein